MKILIFTGYYLPRIGGSVNHIHQIAKRLVILGYQVDLVTFNSEKIDDFECIDGVRVYRLPSHSIINDFEVPIPNQKSIKILRQLLSQRYDLILTYTRFHITSVMGLGFSKIKKIPYIHTELGSSHSVLPSKIFNFLSAGYDHVIGSLIISNASKLICNCNAGAVFLNHLGAKKEVNIIYSGVDFTIFNKNITPQDKKRDEKLGHNNIAVISRLIYAKGVQDSLIAFPKIQAQIPDVKVYIIGDGPYRNQLQQSIDENLCEVITFTGSLSQKEIAELLLFTDVIINPSYSESITSYSVLEGGAMGVPSVTTDVGGAREIILDGINGLLISPKDHDAMVEKTCKLLKNQQLRQELGENIFQFVKKNCDWDKIVKQHCILFESIEEK